MFDPPGTRKPEHEAPLGLPGGCKRPSNYTSDRIDSPIADSQFYELDCAHRPTLTFPMPTAPGSTDTTDGTLTATIQNIGNPP